MESWIFLSILTIYKSCDLFFAYPRTLVAERLLYVPSMGFLLLFICFLGDAASEGNHGFPMRARQTVLRFTETWHFFCLLTFHRESVPYSQILHWVNWISSCMYKPRPYEAGICLSRLASPMNKRLMPKEFIFLAGLFSGTSFSMWIHPRNFKVDIQNSHLKGVASSKPLFCYIF